MERRVPREMRQLWAAGPLIFENHDHVEDGVVDQQPFWIEVDERRARWWDAAAITVVNANSR
jgi:hypothetical protein